MITEIMLKFSVGRQVKGQSMFLKIFLRKPVIRGIFPSQGHFRY